MAKAIGDFRALRSPIASFLLLVPLPIAGYIAIIFLMSLTTSSVEAIYASFGSRMVRLYQAIVGLPLIILFIQMARSHWLPWPVWLIVPSILGLIAVMEWELRSLRRSDSSTTPKNA